jgi:hypothetical protein
MSHNSLHTRRSLITGLICLCIAACGGGGGAGGPTTTPLSNDNSGSSGASSGTTPTPLVPPSPAPSPSQATTADATQARFRGPEGLALDPSGNLYVADTQNFTIRKITRQGVVTTVAGVAGAVGSSDGLGSNARFTEPRGLALDSAGNVYVTDGSAIRKITPAGLVTTIAGMQGQFGDTDGVGALARFHAPHGIVADSGGNLFVADPFDSALRIRKITPTGTVDTFAGGNTGGSTERPHDDIGTLAAFVGPVALAADSIGNLYVADVAMGGLTTSNLYDGASFIRRISTTGMVTTVAGNLGFGSLPAGGPVAQIAHASAVVVDNNGNVFVTDRFNNANRIQKIAASGQMSVLPLDASQFGMLAGLALDADGSLYASDKANHTIVKISQGGTVTIYAGKGGDPGSADTP